MIDLRNDNSAISGYMRVALIAIGMVEMYRVYYPCIAFFSLHRQECCIESGVSMADS